MSVLSTYFEMIHSRAIMRIALLALYFALVAPMGIKIHEFESCDKKMYAFTVATKLKIENDEQKIDAIINLKKDLNDENTYEVNIFRMINDKSFKITGMRGKGSCKLLHDYGVPVFGAIKKAAKIPGGGQCPLPKGKYHMKWHSLPFDEIYMLKMVPKGKFKVNVIIYGPSNVTDCCINVIAEKL